MKSFQDAFPIFAGEREGFLDDLLDGHGGSMP